MATQYRVDPENPDPLDVSRAELWSEDRWQEPMARLRAESPVHYCADSKFGPYWSVTTYKPIQHVEALPKVFSSSRSEEHTSELQSLMRSSYAVFCLKKKTHRRKTLKNTAAAEDRTHKTG